MIEYQTRIKILQRLLSHTNIYILSKPADIQYYTGFTCLNPQERESFLVVSKDRATLLYPSFSPVMKLDGIEYHSGYWPSDLKQVVESHAQRSSSSVIYIDKSSLFVNEFDSLAESKLKFKDLDRDTIWQHRAAKDPQEVKTLTKAAEVTSTVMQTVLEKLKKGMTEIELSSLIELEVRKAGAQGTSFPSVVAFGAHAALPHHQPTDTALTAETVVLIDIGAKVDHYCGDMTRTVWFGKEPSGKFIEIERIVKKAYKAALSEITAGASGTTVDSSARKVIQDAGYGQQFVHTTGHGVGIEIHEQPSLYFKKEAELPKHAVITVEPGIYLKGEFGYRHENMVLVTNDGYKELTN